MFSNYIKFHQSLVVKEIDQDCIVTVVIPVRDESENITSTLAALTSQIDENNCPLKTKSFEIIALVNNCYDNSASIIANWQKAHPNLTLHLAETVLPPEKANIGYVRRWLMNEAYVRLRQNRFKQGIIMTTDGDTQVAPNWIAANLKEIERGCDAVGGRILIKSTDLMLMNTKARRFHLLDTGYRLLAAELEGSLDFLYYDPLPRHHQHFNASFAVTTKVFERAGGIPEVQFLEDVAFFQSLLRIDARFRHSPFVRVLTSSRVDGRTALGLSTQLNEWTKMGENGDNYYVESASEIAERFIYRKWLRKIWQQPEKSFELISILSDKLLIPSDFLENELEIRQTFGSLLEKVQSAQYKNGEWKINHPLVCVTQALNDLRQMLFSLRIKV